MVFEYSFTREEHADANAKYIKKITNMQFVLAILLICLAVVFLVVACIYKFVLRESSDGIGAWCIMLCILSAIYFVLTFVLRRSSKMTAAECFNCYNVDGLLNYRVELTDTEAIVQCKENVSHLPLSGVSRVVTVGSYLFVAFKINVLLVVKISDDTRPLAEIFKNLSPNKK